MTGVGALDLSGRSWCCRFYADDVEPSTPWEVVLYVNQGADDTQTDALADIFLGRGGTVAEQYGPAIGEVHSVRRAKFTLEHRTTHKRIDVVGCLTIEAQDHASADADVQCGIPGLDHPGTEPYADITGSTDPVLTWEVAGHRGAAFATDFDYRSDL